MLTTCMHADLGRVPELELREELFGPNGQPAVEWFAEGFLEQSVRADLVADAKHVLDGVVPLLPVPLVERPRDAREQLGAVVPAAVEEREGKLELRHCR